MKGHGLGRCRYVGKMKFNYQAFLTAMGLNEFETDGETAYRSWIQNERCSV